jgi:hypothetical protein
MVKNSRNILIKLAKSALKPTGWESASELVIFLRSLSIADWFFGFCSDDGASGNFL